MKEYSCSVVCHLALRYLIVYLDSEQLISMIIFPLLLSGVYACDETLHFVAIASSGNLKRWENDY
jgi:hypothetical protein